MLTIWVDVNGTIKANVAGHSDEACAEAVSRLKASGHKVYVCTATPQSSEQFDKSLLLSQGNMRGAIIVDDDASVLSVAVRKGAIAVPAARLLELPELLGAAR